MSRGPPKPPTDASVTQGKNEYIPNFISRKPFYIDDSTLSDADYLEHQRLQSLPQDTLSNSKWYDRGRKVGPAATKFRKGACENCGAITHKTKECLSRPRKTGAKWTGRDIQADEVVEDVKLGWDAKRDRWNGYDAREYSAVIKEYEELEALKKAAAVSDGGRLQPKADGKEQDEGGAVGDEDEEEPDTESAKYDEETDMGRNQPTSTRNLRIREDTAKYLMNLDLESARYDPKTRSMAANVADKTTNGDNDAADENFTRPSNISDDAAEFQRAQRYAWETQERSTAADGKKLHLQANPTEGELLLKKKTAESATKKESDRKALLDKYGGAEHLQPPTTTTAAAAENDRYVEYDADGNVKAAWASGSKQLLSNGSGIDPSTTSTPSSKYAEDVLINNHTSIWGSWWHVRDARWGYQCCHSTIKNSYCTGEDGKKAFADAEKLGRGGLLSMPSYGNGNNNNYNDNEEDGIGREKEQDDHENAGIDEPKTSKQSQKRTFHSIASASAEAVTEAEMEQYKRSKMAADDPMAQFLGKGMI